MMRHLSTYFVGTIMAIALAILSACGGNNTTATDVATEFSAYGVKATVNGKNVLLDLSSLANCATTIENMVVSVNANGAAINPDPSVARDYSAPVEFTITAPDGSKVVYTVTVKGAACLGTSAAAPTPTPSCTAATINPAEPYSLVFKGCDANNVATYYDKTECVRQNSTGLIWQGQTPAGTGLRAFNQNYTHFDSTTELQIANDTTFVAPTQDEVDASTNSIGFKNAVNATNLCGSGAWRLPTKDELLSIVKINAAAPMIDTDWFPNTSRSFWTSSTDAGDALDAWNVDFKRGVAKFNGRGSNLAVRLVH